jgi:hypothetical protein
LDVQLLKQCDFVLSKCGRPMMPKRDLSALYIPRGIFVQGFLQTGSADTLTKEIVGDTPWVLRSISISTTSSTALYWNVQLPNGRFLINNLQDITQVAGYGSWRYLLGKELECPPGSKFIVTLDDSLAGAATAQPVAILFEGAFKYYLKDRPNNGNSANVCTVNNLEYASTLPRYTSDVNQNILAPSWMQGYGPLPPPGCIDEGFTYPSFGDGGAIGPLTVQLAGPLTGTVEIKTDQEYDFEVRRFLFLVQQGPGAAVTAGSFLGRIRAGSGKSFTDDYIDLARYLGSSRYPHDWHVRHGDSIYIDLELVDSAGAGSLQFQAFAEGVRRRPGAGSQAISEGQYEPIEAVTPGPTPDMTPADFMPQPAPFIPGVSGRQSGGPLRTGPRLPRRKW